MGKDKKRKQQEATSSSQSETTTTHKKTKKSEEEINYNVPTDITLHELQHYSHPQTLELLKEFLSPNDIQKINRNAPTLLCGKHLTSAFYTFMSDQYNKMTRGQGITATERAEILTKAAIRLTYGDMVQCPLVAEQIVMWLVTTFNVSTRANSVVVGKNTDISDIINQLTNLVQQDITSFLHAENNISHLRSEYPLMSKNATLPFDANHNLEMLFSDRHTISHKSESDLSLGDTIGARCHIKSLNDLPSSGLGVLIQSRSMGKTKFLLDACLRDNLVPIYIDVSKTSKHSLMEVFLNNVSTLNNNDYAILTLTKKMLLACLIDFYLFYSIGQFTNTKTAIHSYVKMTYSGFGESRATILSNIIDRTPSVIDNIVNTLKSSGPRISFLFALDEIQVLKRATDNGKQNNTLIHSVVSEAHSLSRTRNYKTVVAGTKISLKNLIEPTSSVFKVEEMHLLDVLSTLNSSEVESCIQHYFPFISLTDSMKQRWNNVRVRPVFMCLIGNLIEESRNIHDESELKRIFETKEEGWYKTAIDLYYGWIDAFMKSKGNPQHIVSNPTHTFDNSIQMLVKLFIHILFGNNKGKGLPKTTLKKLFSIGLISISELRNSKYDYCMTFSSKDTFVLEALKKYFRDTKGKHLKEAYLKSIGEITNTIGEGHELERYLILHSSMSFNVDIFSNVISKDPTLKYYTINNINRVVYLDTTSEFEAFLKQKPTNLLLKFKDLNSGPDATFWIEKTPIESTTLSSDDLEIYNKAPTKRLVTIQHKKTEHNSMKASQAVWLGDLISTEKELSIDEIKQQDNDNIGNFKCFADSSNSKGICRTIQCRYQLCGRPCRYFGN